MSNIHFFNRSGMVQLSTNTNIKVHTSFIWFGSCTIQLACHGAWKQWHAQWKPTHLPPPPTHTHTIKKSLIGSSSGPAADLAGYVAAAADGCAATAATACSSAAQPTPPSFDSSSSESVQQVCRRRRESRYLSPGPVSGTFFFTLSIREAKKWLQTSLQLSELLRPFDHVWGGGFQTTSAAPSKQMYNISHTTYNIAQTSTT